MWVLRSWSVKTNQYKRRICIYFRCEDVIVSCSFFKTVLYGPDCCSKMFSRHLYTFSGRCFSNHGQVLHQTFPGSSGGIKIVLRTSHASTSKPSHPWLGYLASSKYPPFTVSATPQFTPCRVLSYVSTSYSTCQRDNNLIDSVKTGWCWKKILRQQLNVWK